MCGVRMRAMLSRLVCLPSEGGNVLQYLSLSFPFCLFVNHPPPPVAYRVHSIELSGLGQVIFLTMGQTAYFGPAIDSLEHFALLGHRPDGLVNPADYLLEV